MNIRNTIENLWITRNYDWIGAFFYPSLFFLGNDSSGWLLESLAFFFLIFILVGVFLSRNDGYHRAGLLLGLVYIPTAFAFAYRAFPAGDCLTGELSEHQSDFLYFSYTTYTTLGYGDIKPIEYCRYLTSLEAMCDLIFMAFVASVFVRRFERH